MESEKRVRVVKLRKKAFTPNPVASVDHTTPVPITRQGRLYKLLRKYESKPDEYTPGDPGEDWDLEKRGDITRFLCMKNYLTGQYERDKTTHQPAFDEDGNVIARSIVGPVTSFRSASLPKDGQPIASKGRRGAHASRFARTIDTGTRFQQKLQQIEDGKDSEHAWTEGQLANMKVGERLVFCRQQKVLNKFKETYKNWARIQGNLSRRVGKDVKDLTVSRAAEYREKLEGLECVDRHRLTNSEKAREFVWYMSLRSTEHKPLEAYERVGDRLSELYARLPERSRSIGPCIKKPGAEKTRFRTFKETVHFQSAMDSQTASKTMQYNPDYDANELQVIGMSKLPLEIESAHSLGLDHLQLHLLPSDQAEEVIVEDHDYKLKY